MEIHVTDDRLGGYFRRYQLALRMMTHGARTQTVCRWTGLTTDQLTTQRRRWGFDPEERRRGPAPTAFHVFFKTRRHRSQAALFASLCHIFGAIPDRTGKAEALRLPGLENGELLCEALEAFREWQPESDLDFEHAVQLATGVVQAEDVTLGECSDCHCSLLIEGSGRSYANCGHCRPQEAAQASRASARQQSNQAVVKNGKNRESEGNPDHVPEGEGCSRTGDPESDRDKDAKEQQPSADDLDHGSQEREDR